MADDDPSLTAVRKKRRPHRRDEILAAAVRLFEEKGYHATGMDDIGAVAGMTGPAIYRHFRNKEDLLETLLLENTSDFVKRARAISAAHADPHDAIIALIDDYADALLDNPGIAVVAAYERRNLRPELHAAISRAERDNLDEWLRALSALHPQRPTAELRVAVVGVMSMAVAMSASRQGPSKATKATLIKDAVKRALDVV